MIPKGLAVIVAMILFTACGIEEKQQERLSDAHEKIGVEFLEAYARRMAGATEHPGRVTPDYVLDHVRNMDALIAEGRARGLVRVPEFRQAVHQFKAELLLRALQPDLVPEIPRESITDVEARAYFDDNIHAYSLPDLYTVTEFSAGRAEDLENIQDPASGGTMPPQGVVVRNHEARQANRFQTQWRSVLEDLEPGDLGPVLPDRDGFVRFRLDSVETGRLQDFEERKEYIRNDVLYARYRKAWQEAYDMLREKHDITIDPDIVREFTLSLERPFESGGQDNLKP